MNLDVFVMVFGGIIATCGLGLLIFKQTEMGQSDFDILGQRVHLATPTSFLVLVLGVGLFLAPMIRDSVREKGGPTSSLPTSASSAPPSTTQPGPGPTTKPLAPDAGASGGRSTPTVVESPSSASSPVTEAKSKPPSSRQRPATDDASTSSAPKSTQDHIQTAEGAAETPPVGPCSRWELGRWIKTPKDISLDGCVQLLFGGKCEGPNSATYGQWGGHTLRLVTGRVEVSDDRRTFRTLADQDSACAIPAL